MQTEISPSGGLLLDSLPQRLPKQTFDTWFRPLKVDVSPATSVFTFSAPNVVVKQWVVKHYAELIEQLLGELSLGHYTDKRTDPPTQKECVDICAVVPKKAAPNGSAPALPPSKTAAPRNDDMNDDIPY